MSTGKSKLWALWIDPNKNKIRTRLLARQKMLLEDYGREMTLGEIAVDLICSKEEGLDLYDGADLSMYAAPTLSVTPDETSSFEDVQIDLDSYIKEHIIQ